MFCDSHENVLYKLVMNTSDISYKASLTNYDAL